MIVRIGGEVCSVDSPEEQRANELLAEQGERQREEVIRIAREYGAAVRRTRTTAGTMRAVRKAMREQYQRLKPKWKALWLAEFRASCAKGD